MVEGRGSVGAEVLILPAARPIPSPARSPIAPVAPIVVGVMLLLVGPARPAGAGAPTAVEIPEPPALPESTGVLLDWVERVVVTLESMQGAAEGDFATALKASEFVTSDARMRQAFTLLDTVLLGDVAHPRANILLARLLRGKSLLLPVVFSGGDRAREYERPLRASMLAALDRALAKHADDAELHHWQALVWATDFAESLGAADHRRAIGAVSRAIELAPDRSVYHVLLATSHLKLGELREAQSALEPLERGRHPLQVLVRDLREIRLPETARLSAQATEFRLMAMRQSGLSWPEARAKVFIVPGEAIQLEPLLRERWPAFRLGKGRSRKEESLQFQIYDFYFRCREDSLQFAGSPEGSRVEPRDIMILKIEQTRGADQKFRELVGAPERGTFTFVVLMNLRGVGE